MTDVRPYIITKAPNGLRVYNYLHVNGGAGHGKKGLGGVYLFVSAYLCCDDNEERGRTSLDIYCKQKKILFGHGNTIEESLADLYAQLEKTPLK